ncbi:MAG: hypothetical protein RJA69_220 [Pseudomonadota bacterium]
MRTILVSKPAILPAGSPHNERMVSPPPVMPPQPDRPRSRVGPDASVTASASAPSSSTTVNPQAAGPLPPAAAPRQATLAAYQALGYNRPPKANRPSMRGRAVTLERAVLDSNSLAQLSALTHESQLRLKSLQGVLPPLLWAQLSAGPIEADTWCVLVSNNAVAAKIRQWAPAMAAHLRTRGWPVQTIRIKVRSSR